MNLDDVKAVKIPRKYSRRVGRGVGSGRGKTAGRGFKGQKSRAGSHRKLGFAGGQMPLFRRLPKRGFSNYPFKVEYAVVNVGDLGASFQAKAAVGPDEIKAAGLVPRSSKLVKVLGGGELKLALTVRAHKFSAKAKDAIAKAGGTAEEIAAK
jgi:large subunit ribosomal protein L15